MYESAPSQNLRLSLHPFNALLYLYSNFATDPSAKDSAINYGFRVFNHMLSNKAVPNEASVMSIVRLASAKKDGDYAFELIKKMNKEYNLVPRLRTYDPPLLCFCENLEAEKAYEVEKHMGSIGVRLEEQEIAALLKDWFCGEKATGVKGVSFDEGLVKEAILKDGGGWHRPGWIGDGNWVSKRGSLDENGKCCCCGHQLVSVDIDDAETEKFAQSIARLALERETLLHPKDWLEQYAADYEAIVDGANIGLYLQNFAEGGFSIPQESEKGSWHVPILINNDESSQTWLCITRPSVVESCDKAKALENTETSEDGHGLCWNNETLNSFNT
ncbi:hypothetical protein EZV62_018633 [Acer yangbiense]|uniref:ribonuclease P n=1 Tax=Acer yangbiense TaxID=1000413 RepID=A0A5C7HJX6_9ROSI|nr:hypothetical protein EZV62_018633 [Acer yangbiense]